MKIAIPDVKIAILLNETRGPPKQHLLRAATNKYTDLRNILQQATINRSMVDMQTQQRKRETPQRQRIEQQEKRQRLCAQSTQKTKADMIGQGRLFKYQYGYKGKGKRG